MNQNCPYSDPSHKNAQGLERTITAEPSLEWDWRRHNPFLFSEINSLKRDGSITDSPAKQKDIRAWMLDLLPKFKEEFDPRIEKIMGDLQDQDTNHGF